MAAAAGALAGLSCLELLALIRAGCRPARGGRRALAPAPALAVARRLVGQVPDDLTARIEAARLPRAIDAQSVMGVKVAMAAAAGVIAFPVASLAGGGAATLMLVAAPALAFLAPDLLLRRMGRRTKARVAAELSDVAARVHLAITAGLPPVRAAAAAGSAGGGPLAAELARAAASAEAGTPFADALSVLAGRCPTADVGALAGALLRSQEQGTDIAAHLDEIARASRRRESLRIRDRAQRAGPKIQLAVALLLVPAAMCLIAAALLSGLFSA